MVLVNLGLCLQPGASTLDPEMCGRYKLSVMVKDMAGKANAFFNTGLVTVEVTGNTWASPDPVRLQENLPGPYPIPISQVSLSFLLCIETQRRTLLVLNANEAKPSRDIKTNWDHVLR